MKNWERAIIFLFEKLLGEEEEHLNFFANTKEHLAKLGTVYLASLTGA